MKIKKLAKNNKGVTLVELLVAIGVSGVVMGIIAAFIMSGSRFYRKQSTALNMQNEMQEVSNRISDALMEANAIYIDNGADGIHKMYTAPVEGYEAHKVTKFEYGYTTGKYILLNNHSLYIMDALNIPEADQKGYEFSNIVTSVQIKVNDSCKVTQGEIVSYRQPLMFDVTITMDNGSETRTDTKTTTLRNTISKFYIDGTTQILLN